MSRRHSLMASCLALVIAVTLAAPVAAGQVRLRVTATPSPLNFGSLAVGQESAPQILYVTNRSNIPIQVTNILNSISPNSIGSWGFPDVGVGSDCFGLPNAIIAPGQTCAVDAYTFHPAATGAQTLSITVTFTTGVETVTLSLTAKGRGI